MVRHENKMSKRMCVDRKMSHFDKVTQVRFAKSCAAKLVRSQSTSSKRLRSPAVDLEKDGNVLDYQTPKSISLCENPTAAVNFNNWN